MRVSFVCLLLFLSLCKGCEAQHVTVRAPDGAYACGFRTRVGLITVAHLEGVGGVWINRDFDCRMIKNNSGALHDIGEGGPCFFRCRRGRKHSLTILSTEKTQWIVSSEFYPGESGLPVFNREGQVVGLVLGNRVGNVYRGRVGRLREVPEFRLSLESEKKNSEVAEPVDTAGLTVD